MAIQIQKAKEEDIPFLVTMILKSARADKKIGLFDYLFQEEIEKKLAELVASKKHPYCFYKNFFVAKIGAQKVGTLCVYEPRVATKERFVEALAEIEPDAIVRLEQLRECDFAIDKKVLMLDFLEEDDAYLDMGIIKELVQKSLLEARLKGYRRAQTIVEIGSLESLLFYEHLGFAQKERKECPSYQEVFGRSGLILLELFF